MFGLSRPGAAAYRQLSVTSDALAASPHQLVLMLFDGALDAIRTAQAQIERQDTEGKGRSITRAIDIIGSGLSASLDKQRGGEIAGNLASLYDYLVRELVASNLRNDTVRLGQCAALLQDLRSSWAAITPAASGAKVDA